MLHFSLAIIIKEKRQVTKHMFSPKISGGLELPSTNNGAFCEDNCDSVPSNTSLVANKNEPEPVCNVKTSFQIIEVCPKNVI